MLIKGNKVAKYHTYFEFSCLYPININHSLTKPRHTWRLSAATKWTKIHYVYSYVTRMVKFSFLFI